ncbi:D-Ala-D-Ala carboxypeptidase family metallohydrolase, partial [Myxococcota bacterium]|nr:D-Ala-D-Ala carboxypeptidase family metallohydrolase [Myxococcota bacterium]
PDDDTAAPDDDTAAPDDDTAAPDDDTTPEPPPSQVCYPGPALDGTACVPVVPASGISDPGGEYEYGDPAASPDPLAYQEPDRYVDLLAVDGGFDLAPHFALDEFMQSWKGRYGLTSPAVVELMETIRTWRGEPLYVTSGYRSPAYNAAQPGAATWSRHLYGDAVDFYMAGTGIGELEDDCVALGADYTALYDDGHVHCDWRDLPLEPGFFDPATGLAPFERRSPSAASLAPGRGAGDARAGDPVSYRVLHAGFDEGAPRVEWRVLDPGGAVAAAGEGLSVLFVPEVPGPHRIEARVGGRAAFAEATVDVAPSRSR